MKRTQIHLTRTPARRPADDHEEPGTFGTLFRLRKERRLREARTQRETRLVQLDRDIAALEAWHHTWSTGSCTAQS